MQKRVFIAVVFILGLNLFSFAQSSRSILNQPAPALNFGKVINYEKPNIQASDFKSKIIILDFWATWCAPCIASFPKLEQLQKKYNDKIQIITITDETEQRINSFLTKRKFSLPIVFDTNGKLGEAFPHRTLPHTVIIDNQNIVRAVTISSQVTEDLIDKIIAGQQLSIEEKKDDYKLDLSKPLSVAGNSIYQTTLMPYQEGYQEGVIAIFGPGPNPYANRRITAVNAGLKLLYEAAYQFPRGVLTFVEAKDKSAFEQNKRNSYCYDLILPDELGDKKFSIMQEHLSTLFPYRAAIETRKVNVKVLRKIAGSSPVLKTGSGKSSSMLSSQGLVMVNASFSKVTEFLQIVLKVPVVDETGVTGNYDLELPFLNESPEEIHPSLKKIGFELIEESRPMKVLAIYDK